MNEDLSLMANPRKVKISLIKEEKSNNYDYHDELKNIIEKQYNNIYLSDEWINKLKKMIESELDELLINRIVEECLEYCIEEVCKKKFDFVIPFD